MRCTSAWCEAVAVEGFDEDRLTGVVGPARVHQRHSVVSEDGVDVHHAQILQGSGNGIRHDVGWQVVCVVSVAVGGQTVFRHLSESLSSDDKIAI